MKPDRITEILRQHSQDYKIKDGRIYGIAYWTNLITGEEGTEESDVPTPTPGMREQAEERELAKMEMLPEGAPRFYLTTYYLEIPRGTSLDRLSFVRDIEDDSENESDLYRRIQIDGDVDIYTPGSYELIYYVVDNDGNTSNQAVLTVVVQ